MAPGRGPGDPGVVPHRPSDVVDLGSRRREREDRLAAAAAAPVLHVTPEFLAALNCRDDEPQSRPVRHLRAV